MTKHFDLSDNNTIINKDNVPLKAGKNNELINRSIQRAICPEESSPVIVDWFAIRFTFSNSDELNSFYDELIVHMRMLGCSIGELKESSFQWPRGQCLIVNVGISKHYLGSIKLNEQEFTLKYQLTGKGVEWLRQSDPYLIRLHDWAEAHNGQLLKIHLAFDDTSGKYNIRRAEKDYSAGYYDPERGARPKKGKQGDKANGQTLTIGSLDAVCHVCIYEKDKELGLPVNSELFGKWVRHELKLRHIQRKPLVLDMLVQPAAYFKARYKAHNKMLKKVRGLKLPRLINISTSLDLAKRFKWLRRQCGPFIQFNRQIGIDAETFVNMAAREGNQNQYHQHKLLQKEEVLELYQEFCQGFIDEEERV